MIYTHKDIWLNVFDIITVIAKHFCQRCPLYLCELCGLKHAVILIPKPGLKQEYDYDDINDDWLVAFLPISISKILKLFCYKTLERRAQKTTGHNILEDSSYP